MGAVVINLASEMQFVDTLSGDAKMMLKEVDEKRKGSGSGHLYAAPCDEEGEKTIKDDKSEKAESNEDEGNEEGGADDQESGGDDQADANGGSGAGGDSGEGSGSGDGKDDKEKDSDKATDDGEDEGEERETKEIEEERKEDDATDGSKAAEEKTEVPEEVKAGGKAGPLVQVAGVLSVSGEKSISLSPGKGKKKVVEEDEAGTGGEQTAKKTKISE